MNQLTLQQALPGRPIRFYASTGSTMRDAHDWLSANPHLANGALIVADEQRTGRGRLQRTWLTPPGTAIAISLILRGTIHATMLGAVAIAEGITAHTGLAATLKYPNDVQINGRKVAGILAESVWQGDQHLATILGMGINIAIDFSQTELAESATSLNHHLPHPVDRVALIAAIIAQIDHWQRQPDALFTAWQSRLTTLGQAITVHTDGQAIAGVADSVDRDGALWLRLPDGTRQRFLAADVSLRGDA